MRLCLRLLLHSIWPDDYLSTSPDRFTRTRRAFIPHQGASTSANRSSPPSFPAIFCARATKRTPIDGSPGQFHVNGSTVEIQPSKDSYFQGNNALRVTFSGSDISKISQLSGISGQPRDFAEIRARGDYQPVRLGSREKRRIERFDDLPTVMVNAVLAAEWTSVSSSMALSILSAFLAQPFTILAAAARPRAPARSTCRWRGPSFSLPSVSGAASQEGNPDGGGTRPALLQARNSSSSMPMTFISATAAALPFAVLAKRPRPTLARMYAN